MYKKTIIFFTCLIIATSLHAMQMRPFVTAFKTLNQHCTYSYKTALQYNKKLITETIEHKSEIQEKKKTALFALDLFKIGTFHYATQKSPDDSHEKKLDLLYSLVNKSLTKENAEFDIIRDEPSLVELLDYIYDLPSVYRSKLDPRHLMFAAKSNAHHLASNIIKCFPGAIHLTDKSGRTPLHWAAAAGSVEVAKLLIERGANVNVKDKNDNTPLFGCSSNEIIKLLIEKGANINERCNGGNTALHFAVQFRRDTIDTLLLHGADCTRLKNYQGKSAQDIEKERLKKQHPLLSEKKSSHTCTII